VLLEPFVDTAQGRLRPFSIEGGIDLDINLDDHDMWSFRGELGGAHFFEPALDLLHATAGASCNVTPALELSAIALVGLAARARGSVSCSARPRASISSKACSAAAVIRAPGRDCLIVCRLLANDK
jgi:hypothetical protein